jgi:RNA polymerase sigma factor (sigma-70 family)
MGRLSAGKIPGQLGASPPGSVSAHQARTATDNALEHSEPGDAALLRRMADGDQAALDVLYARHAPGLLRYLLGWGNDRAEAEEILQDTFVAAWRAARGFQGRASVRTWLFAIAQRQARDRHRRHGLTLEPETELDGLADTATGPEASLLAQTEISELAAAIAQLPPRQRQVLALMFVHELSQAEIAQVLEIPVGTVKSRLSSARRTLQAKLTPGGEMNE